LATPFSLSGGAVVSIKPRDLVSDNRDRIGIVLRKEKIPSQKWLADQLDERVREFRSSTWWGILPLSGGYVLAPEGLLTYVREATNDDVMVAIEYANMAAVKNLLEIFPELRQRFGGGAQ
jgi:hypothetical protein